MFNLRKLMISVKKGDLFSRPFNIKKKAWEDYDEQGEIPSVSVQEQESRSNDAAAEREIAEFLAMKEREQAADPYSVRVQQGYDNGIPIDVDEKMDHWIKNNMIAISSVSESEIGADPFLYREIGKHPEYKSILSEKILQAVPVLNEEESSLVADIMLFNTQNFMGEIERKEFEMSGDKLVGEEVQPEIDSFQDLTKQVQIKFLENSGAVNSVMRMKFTPDMLSDAIEDRFAPPKSINKLDQRFNFFLYNTNFLDPIIQNDPNFFKMFNQANTKNQKIFIMKQAKGEELINVLSELIDKLDPSIINWVKKGFPYMGKAVGGGREILETDLIQGDDDGRPMTMEGQTPSDWSDLSITGSDRAESLRFMSNAVKYYLTDNILDMSEINNDVTLSLMNKSVNDLKKSISDHSISGGSIPPSEKKNILNKYVMAERLNAYFSGHHKQVMALYEDDGSLSKSGDKILYKNKDGQMAAPVDMMKDMLGISKKYYEEQVEKRTGIQNYRMYVDAYRESIKNNEIGDPFNPDWKSMIYTVGVMRNMADFGEIKNKIFDLKDKKFTDPSAVEKVLSKGRDKELLSRFAGVNGPLIDKKRNEVIRQGDSPEIIKQKINDFIFMTLNQNRDDSHMGVLLDAYKKKKDNDKQQKDLDILKDKLKTKYNKSDEKNIIKMQKDLNYNFQRGATNFKTIMGTYYTPILPDLVKIKNQNRFLPSSLLGYMEIFDTHPTKIRNFLDIGMQINTSDPLGRTNTELYYDARGEDLPPHVAALKKIYDHGVETKEINKDKWYKELFDEYGGFDIYQRTYDKKKKRLDVLKDQLKDKVQKANNKILNIMRKDKKGVVFQKVLNNIKEPEAQVEFQRYIDQWDGIEEMPLDYYGFFGQKKTKDVIENGRESVDKVLRGAGGNRSRRGEEGLNEVIEKFKQQKINVRNKLKERNLDIDLSALKIAKSMYRVLQDKILKLSRIKEYGYKFASINISEIDNSINILKNDFDKLFIFLFS